MCQALCWELGIKERHALLPWIWEKYHGEDQQVNKSLEISMIPISLGVMYKDSAQRKEHVFVCGWLAGDEG